MDNKPKTKDFAVCNDVLSCNFESQKDSNETLARYYGQKNTRANISPRPHWFLSEGKVFKDFSRLRVDPHFSSGIVERAKRDSA